MQQEIAAIIQRELKDPRLGFVTITRVELSGDLGYATVWYSCLGSESLDSPRQRGAGSGRVLSLSKDEQERRRSQEALEHAAGFIHGLIKKRFRLKVIPEVRFRYDASIEGSIEISEMLDQLKDSKQ
jgi:ribosome-binding factor A